jgi:diacylglycerol kinase (ATP)
MAPAQVLVLVNPRAGGGRGRRLVEPMRRWLLSHAPGVRLEAIDGVDKAEQLIQAGPIGLRVVLVGGDGTVHRMLASLLVRRCELGLVPAGSGNDIARALGLAAMGWERALDHALRAPSAPIDVGECAFGGRTVLFLSSLTGGFDAAVGARALKAPAWLGGSARYLWATLRELQALQTWRMRVRLDGREVHLGRTLFASALNTPTYGAGLPAVPQARSDDGQLDALLAGRFGRAGALAMLPRLMLGRHLSHPRVSTETFTEMIVDSESAVPLAADGEPVGRAHSWRVRVRIGALPAVGRPVSV